MAKTYKTRPVAVRARDPREKRAQKHPRTYPLEEELTIDERPGCNASFLPNKTTRRKMKRRKNQKIRAEGKRAARSDD